MAECAGAEPEPEPEPEPEAEKSGGMGSLALVLALVVLGGGGAFAYIKFIRPKQASKVSADPDDYDFADEEEYILSLIHICPGHPGGVHHQAPQLGPLGGCGGAPGRGRP